MRDNEIRHPSLLSHFPTHRLPPPSTTAFSKSAILATSLLPTLPPYHTNTIWGLKSICATPALRPPQRASPTLRKLHTRPRRHQPSPRPGPHLRQRPQRTMLDHDHRTQRREPLVSAPRPTRAPARAGPGCAAPSARRPAACAPRRPARGRSGRCGVVLAGGRAV